MGFEVKVYNNPHSRSSGGHEVRFDHKKLGEAIEGGETPQSGGEPMCRVEAQCNVMLLGEAGGQG